MLCSSIGIDRDADQRIRGAVRPGIRKSQVPLALVKSLRALCISAEIERLVLFSCYSAVGLVRLSDQVLDLFHSHADLQLREFTGGGRNADDFSPE